MSSTVSGNYITLDTIVPYLRGFKHQGADTPAAWAKSECTGWNVGSLILRLETTPQAGEGRNKSPKYKAVEMAVVVGHDGERAIVLSIATHAYELVFLESWLNKRAQAAASVGRDFEYVLVRPSRKISPSAQAEVERLGRFYARGGVRKEKGAATAEPSDPAIAILQVMGLQLNPESNKPVLDLAAFAKGLLHGDGGSIFQQAAGVSQSFTLVASTEPRESAIILAVDDSDVLSDQLPPAAAMQAPPAPDAAEQPATTHDATGWQTFAPPDPQDTLSAYWGLEENADASPQQQEPAPAETEKETIQPPKLKSLSEIIASPRDRADRIKDDLQSLLGYGGIFSEEVDEPAGPEAVQLDSMSIDFLQPADTLALADQGTANPVETATNLGMPEPASQPPSSPMAGWSVEPPWQTPLEATQESAALAQEQPAEAAPIAVAQSQVPLAEPAQVEGVQVEAPLAEPAQLDAAHAEAPLAEPTQVEAAHAEAPPAEPTQVEAAHAEAPLAEPAQLEAAHAEAPPAEPTQVEAAQAQVPVAEATQLEPAQLQAAPGQADGSSQDATEQPEVTIGEPTTVPAPTTRAALSRVALHEGPAIATGMEGHVAKLEQQVTKAGNKLSSQVDKIRLELENELKQLLARASEAATKIERAINNASTRVFKQLDNTAEEIRLKTADCSANGRYSINRQLDSAKAALDEAQTSQVEPLAEACAAVRTASQDLTDELRLALSAANKVQLEELQNVISAAAIEIAGVGQQQVMALKTLFEQSKERLGSEVSHAAGLIDRRIDALNSDLSSSCESAGTKIELCVGEYRNSLEHAVHKCVGDLGRAFQSQLVTHLRPACHNHRMRFRQTTYDLRTSLLEDAHARQRQYVHDLYDGLSQTKQSVHSSLEESLRNMETIGQDESGKLSSLFTESTTMIMQASVELVSHFQQTEEQINQHETNARKYVESAGMEFESALIALKDAAGATLHRQQEQAAEMLTSASEAHAENLERLLSDAQNALSAIRVERNRELAELSRTRISEIKQALSQAFQTIKDQPQHLLKD